MTNTKNIDDRKVDEKLPSENDTDKDEQNDKTPDKEPDPKPDNQEPDKKPNDDDNNKPSSKDNNNSTAVNKPTTTEPPTSSSGVTTKGFAIEVKDGVTYIDGYLVVNKTYPLPSTYVPTNPQVAVTTANCANCLDKDAYAAYSSMKSDAAKLGLNLWIASGFRSYSYQNALYSGYVNSSGKTAADTYSARPGHSEHQSGLAFDLNTVSESFAQTQEGKWVNENCYKYGFIIRYPKGKDNETGYIYEPWHLRYVGVDLASKLYNGGNWTTMETYFGITSTYQN